MNRTVADKYKDYSFKYLSLIEFSDLIQICEDKDFLYSMDELKDKHPTKYLDKLKKYQQEIENNKPKQQKNAEIFTPKCPTCGSADIKKISGTKRWFGVGLFGLASSDIGKTMCCNNCGYKW